MGVLLCLCLLLFLACAKVAPDIAGTLMYGDKYHRGWPVKGIVYEKESNTPIAGVKISLAQPSETGQGYILFQAISDSAGLFSMDNIPDVDYILVAERAGYKTHRQRIRPSQSEMYTDELWHIQMKKEKQDDSKVLAPAKATEIKFNLPSATDVKLEIFNINGQKVMTLVNRKLEAGEHVILWDSKGFVHGIYVYKLEAGDFKESKTVIVK